MEIKILKNILGANDQIALSNRKYLESQRIFTLNILSSPGAGKTTFILATAQALERKLKLGVIEGDVAGSIDAERISQAGLPAVQINTGGECHLDANMVRTALDNLPLESIEVLIIENVGNLICTAEFALGENIRIVISSIPEGDDKPIKYPMIFRTADAVVITKMDLLPYVKFDLAAFIASLKLINPQVEIFQTSAVSGAGLPEWIAWLLTQYEKTRNQI